MKKRYKLLTCILIILILFNFVFNQSVSHGFTAIIGSVVLGAAKIASIGLIVIEIAKFIVLFPGLLMNAISTTLAEFGGKTDGSQDGVYANLYDIFFGKLGITDINVLEMQYGVGNTKESFSDTSIFYKMRENIRNWYGGIRNFSLIVLLCILIYVGIRMAISTIADEQAKYKTMLKDWIVAIVLVFLLHYIMIFTFAVNDALIQALDPGTTGENISQYNEEIAKGAYGVIHGNNIADDLACAFLYSMLAGATFSFLFLYIKRMLTVSFLALIAPIITITYPIDKMGDRKISGIKYLVKRICF